MLPAVGGGSDGVSCAVTVGAGARLSLWATWHGEGRAGGCEWCAAWIGTPCALGKEACRLETPGYTSGIEWYGMM